MTTAGYLIESKVRITTTWPIGASEPTSISLYLEDWAMRPTEKTVEFPWSTSMSEAALVMGSGVTSQLQILSLKRPPSLDLVASWRIWSCCLMLDCHRESEQPGYQIWYLTILKMIQYVYAQYALHIYCYHHGFFVFQRKQRCAHYITASVCSSQFSLMFKRHQDQICFFARTTSKMLVAWCKQAIVLMRWGWWGQHPRYQV